LPKPAGNAIIHWLCTDSADWQRLRFAKPFVLRLVSPSVNLIEEQVHGHLQSEARGVSLALVGLSGVGGSCRVRGTICSTPSCDRSRSRDDDDSGGAADEQHTGHDGSSGKPNGAHDSQHGNNRRSSQRRNNGAHAVRARASGRT
jgi:hypothetical protein